MAALPSRWTDCRPKLRSASAPAKRVRVNEEYELLHRSSSSNFEIRNAEMEELITVLKFQFPSLPPSTIRRELTLHPVPHGGGVSRLAMASLSREEALLEREREVVALRGAFPFLLDDQLREELKILPLGEPVSDEILARLEGLNSRCSAWKDSAHSVWRVKSGASSPKTVAKQAQATEERGRPAKRGTTTRKHIAQITEEEWLVSVDSSPGRCCSSQGSVSGNENRLRRFYERTAKQQMVIAFRKGREIAIAKRRKIDAKPLWEAYNNAIAVSQSCARLNAELKYAQMLREKGEHCLDLHFFILKDAIEFAESKLTTLSDNVIGNGYVDVKVITGKGTRRIRRPVLQAVVQSLTSSRWSVIEAAEGYSIVRVRGPVRHVLPITVKRKRKVIRLK